MKKIILSAAIAAICAIPAASIAADNDLYGQLRYSFNSVDDPDNGKEGLSGNDNVSLFGLKGSASDQGLTAFYHLQTGAPADNNGGQAFNQRFYFGGLKGGFGKAAYGRMTNSYKFDGFKLDPFYNLSHINAAGNFATGGASYGLSPATNGFTDNALQYTSPAFSGITVNAGVYIDDGNDDDHGSSLGLTWKSKGMNAGIQYASNAQTATIPGIAADGNAIRIHGGYKAKGWSAGLSYETVDDSANTSTDYMYVVGRFNVAKKTQLIGAIGVVSPDSNSSAAALAAEGTGFQLGVFQTVVPKTQLYVTYGQASLDAAGAEDPSVLSVGAIHKFGFGG
jgi:hypothetical protein